MRRILRALELPLLVKELKELAARRRTYIVRFVYALVLFVGSCVLLYGGFATRGASVMGQGRPLFEALIQLQLWAIVLFLPATAAGVLTAEKERDALGLLLLTTLRPGQILIQKWLSRLVPMLSFLMLSFPLLAVAYARGGVETPHLFWGITALLLTCLQVGAVAVMCSAYFRTTAEAFVASYCLLAVMLFVFSFSSGINVFDRAFSGNYEEAFVSSMLVLMSIGVCLLVGRIVLLPRAFVPPRNVLLQFFKVLDEFFNSANSLTGGIVLVKDKDVRPLDKPVAWRETRKKSLGTFRYLFRVLTVLEVPILFATQLINTGGRASSTTSVTVLLYVIWCVSLGMVAVHAAGLISSERSRQTLNVLLATPIDGPGIISQKFSGVRRLMAVLFVPFLTIFVFETWWYSESRWLYLLLSVLLVAVHLPLAAWFSLWVGLRLRSQLRAIITSLVCIAAVAIFPAVLGEFLPASLGDLRRYWLIINPVEAVLTVEQWGQTLQELSDPTKAYYSIIVRLSIHLALYGSLLWFVRRMCFRAIDTRLGRIAPATCPTMTAEPRAAAPQEALA